VPGRRDREVLRQPFHQAEQGSYEMAHAITVENRFSRSFLRPKTSSVR
jgi:hypothetical protein